MQVSGLVLLTMRPGMPFPPTIKKMRASSFHKSLSGCAQGPKMKPVKTTPQRRQELRAIRRLLSKE